MYFLSTEKILVQSVHSVACVTVNCELFQVETLQSQLEDAEKEIKQYLETIAEKNKQLDRQVSLFYYKGF